MVNPRVSTCPENRTPSKELLSDYENEKLGNHKEYQKLKPSVSHKLIPHYLTMKIIFSQYRNLKYAHELGDAITSFHTAV